MTPFRPRATAIAAASAVLLASLGLSAAVSAADSPESAVNEFLDLAAAGDFSAMESVVCAAGQEAVREAFDISGQLGLEGDAALTEALTFQVEDRSVEVTSQDGDTATVAVMARLSLDVPEDQVEVIVRAVLEADRGPDDPPVSDDDVDLMLGFMSSAFNQTQTIDEEATVIRENGEWLVCGGLVDEPEEPDLGFEPTVSSEGMCAIATPDELSALGALRYDSSSGFGEFCSYSSSDFDAYHTASVSLLRDEDIADIAPIFGAEVEMEVAGAPAFATDPEVFGTQLLTQVGEDILQVSVFLDPGVGSDWLGQATLITELLAPRVPGIREAIVGPAPEPTPQPTPQVSLCEALSVDALNAQTGLGFDDAQGDAYYCSYDQIDGEPGWHNVTLSLAELALDDYRLWLPDAEETTVAGQPALVDVGQIIVELPGGAWTLTASGWVDTADETTTLETGELQRLAAEAVVPNVTVPEATFSDVEAVDLEALQAAIDTDTGLADGGSSLGRPLCDYVDLDAINALGIIEFDEAGGLYEGMCTVSRTDPVSGYAALTMLADSAGIEEIRGLYDDGTDIDVAGRPGFIGGPDLYIETSAGPIAFYPDLPDEAVLEGMDPSELTVPVAELIVAAIEAAQ